MEEKAGKVMMYGGWRSQKNHMLGVTLQVLGKI